jgi:hypothetical protein
MSGNLGINNVNVFETPVRGDLCGSLQREVPKGTGEGVGLEAPARYDREGARRPIMTGCSHIVCRVCKRGSYLFPSPPPTRGSGAVIFINKGIDVNVNTRTNIDGNKAAKSARVAGGRPE